MDKLLMKMMRKFTYILALSALLLSACNADDEAAMPNEGRKITLGIPVEWRPYGKTSGETAEASAASRVGDPGVAEEMLPPAHLYLFTWLRAIDVGSAYDRYECIFTQKTLTAADWNLVDKNTSSERYELLEAVRIELTEPTATDDYYDGLQVGRTYAIASSRDITADELKSLVGTDCASLIDNPGKVMIFSKGIGEALDGVLRTATLGIGSWEQEELRDLYSTPFEDPALDANGLKNGRITHDRTKFPASGVGHGAVRLYHSVAKIDFQWEVAPALQDTTAVQSITISDLPALLHIFEPTANLKAEGTYEFVIGTNPGNKWIGRKYFYAAQPEGAGINYTAAFEDLDGNNKKKADVSGTFTPGKIHPNYTGWYRIPALVN